MYELDRCSDMRWRLVDEEQIMKSNSFDYCRVEYAYANTYLCAGSWDLHILMAHLICSCLYTASECVKITVQESVAHVAQAHVHVGLELLGRSDRQGRDWRATRASNVQRGVWKDEQMLKPMFPFYTG